MRRPSIAKFKFMSVLFENGCQWHHTRVLSVVYKYHSIGSSFPMKLLHNGQLWCASRVMFWQHGIRQQRSPSFPTAASFNSSLVARCARLYFTDVVTFCLQLGQTIRAGSTKTGAIKSWNHRGLRKNRSAFGSLEFEDSPWPNCTRPRWTIALEDCEVWTPVGMSVFVALCAS